jgi:hypothetical protein
MLPDCRGNFFLIAHIAGISGSRAASGGDFFCDRFGVVEVLVENAHGRTTSRKHERDGTSDAAPPPVMILLFCHRDGIRLARSEGDTSFPRNEIFLRLQLSFGAVFAAGNSNHKIENAFAHLLDRAFAGDDGAGVNVSDVGHTRSQV